MGSTNPHTKPVQPTAELGLPQPLKPNLRWVHSILKNWLGLNLSLIIPEPNTRRVDGIFPDGFEAFSLTDFFLSLNY